MAVRLTTDIQRFLDDTVFLAALFDAPGLDGGASSRLIKLRDMSADVYNVDTLYILAVSDAIRE